MGRIDDVFALRNHDTTARKALITYLCCGDPDEQSSVELALACAEEGADIIELGIPFSDPTADGPAIARASQRALRSNTGLDGSLRIARAVRDRSNVPIVLFGYYNPIFVRGEAEVIRQARESGVDALLVVDLPVDESVSLRETAAGAGIAVIPLVAPTTSPSRIEALGQLATKFPIPFIYSISMMGVTGGAGSLDVLEHASAQAAHIRRVTARPTVVGFGIDSPTAARTAATHADGVVVGSALVRLVEHEPSQPARIARVRGLVRELAAAVQST